MENNVPVVGKAGWILRLLPDRNFFVKSLEISYDLQETTSTTLAWGFSYILLAPDVQKHLHAELDRVVGSDRLITMDDRPSLPHTNAVIMVN